MIQPRSKEQRESDPNIPQRSASDPSASVWVSASAGTGKTKVLTDRVLRLLLPDIDRKATPPHRILCITFTKAAAAEMAIRINERLAAWAIMDDDALIKEMEEKLLGKPPTQEQIEVARTLFTQVIDTPGGLKIMTIHAFCQSVLGRFPLESGLTPNFKVIDEREATQFLTQARDQVLKTSKETDNKVLTNIATEQNEDQLTELLKIVLKERLQLSRLSRRYPDPSSLFEGLCDAFSCPVCTDPREFMKEICHTKSFNEKGMRQICTAMAQGTKTDQGRSVSLQVWLDAEEGQRIDLFEKYYSDILTQKETPRKLTQKIVNFDPACEPVWLEEADRLKQAKETLKKLHETHLTRDLVLLGTSILKEYQKKKTALNLLDYDDLILSTLDLLQKEGQNAWVLFKLDGGLDHILLDEAQDTNPEQWEIIDRLSSDFFSGQGQAEDITRTVFVVGDEKQSIYSFQRADPDSFQRMRDHFRTRITNAHRTWKDIDLFVSFRSCDAVLNLVDQVFAAEEERASLALPKDQCLSHESFRTGQAGLVELWPLYEREEEEEEKSANSGWKLPVSPVNRKTAIEHMAQDMALKIKGWLDRQEYLPSKDRPIHAGDIMILLRTRTKLVNPIVRALKHHNIPVSGVDRMVLKERIEILDLLALGKFCRLTEDDLSLACFLKSPLIDMSEETLYEVAVDRKGSLWKALRERKDLDAIAHYISALINRSRTLRPFEFYNTVLNMSCPAGSKNTSALRAFIKRLGEDVLDPLEAFLNEILIFEQDNIPTLEGFLHWMEHSSEEIKRQIEEKSQQVRIMTIHGAKGLEAPIVFLPDTIMSPGAMKSERFLWPHKTKLDTPIWSPRSADASSFYKEHLHRSQKDLKQEYRRQLYVALTRAEDRLYICGCKGKNEPDKESWFFSIKNAMEELGEQDGALYRYQREQVSESVPKNTIKEKPAKEKPAKEKPAAEKETVSLPGWAMTPCPIEPDPPMPLVPSKPSIAEPAFASPLDKENNNRFKRGNITHKLLQLLPDLPAHQWEESARFFVSKDTYRLSQVQQGSIVSETLKILNDPDFSDIFGPGSMAEVPITGLLHKNQLVSGQIDRLLIKDDKILIVDYKTNRPSPKEAKNIPETYVHQMRLYKELISKIYPGRDVSCALIWTDDARLMPVNV